MHHIPAGGADPGIFSKTLLGLSTFRGKSYCICSVFRAFHLSVGKPYWYCSVYYYYYYFLSAKKKIYTVIRIEKLWGPLCSTSQKTLLIHPTYLTSDPIRSYSTFCEKPLLADLPKNHWWYRHGTLTKLMSVFRWLKICYKFN